MADNTVTVKLELVVDAGALRALKTLEKQTAQTGRRARQNFSQAQRSTSAFTTETLALGGAFNKAYRSLLPFVGAFAGFQALAVGTRRAQEFGKAVAEIATIADRSILDIEQLRENLIGIGVDVGVREAQVAAGAYQAISAGIEGSTESITEFTRASVNLARVGLAGVGPTVDILTSILNAYNLEVSEAGSVTDVLFKTVQRGKTTIPELATTLGRTIPLAAALNVTLEEVAASLITLTKSGLRTDIATTALRGVFSQLLDPAEEAKKIFEDFDIDVTRTRISMEGLIPVLQDLAALPAELRARAVPDVRAQTALEILVQNLDDVRVQFEEVTKAADDSTDVVNDALAVFLEFPEIQAEVTLNAIGQAASELGRAFIIAFAELTAAATGGDRTLEDFRDIARDTGRVVIETSRAVARAVDKFSELREEVALVDAALDLLTGGARDLLALFVLFTTIPDLIGRTFTRVAIEVFEFAKKFPTAAEFLGLGQAEEIARGAFDPKFLKPVLDQYDASLSQGFLAAAGIASDRAVETFRQLMKNTLPPIVFQEFEEQISKLRMPEGEPLPESLITADVLELERELASILNEQAQLFAVQAGNLERLSDLRREQFQLETQILAARLEELGATEEQIKLFKVQRKLVEDLLDFSRTGGAGFAAGITDGLRAFVLEASDTFRATGQLVADTLFTISSESANSLVDIVSGAEDVGDALRESLRTVLDEFARRAATIGFDVLFSELLGGLLPDAALESNTIATINNTLALIGLKAAITGAGVLSGVPSLGLGVLPGGGGAGGAPPSAAIPRFGPFAEGGIITQPTLAMMGEGRAEEAVIPLSRGAVPVDMRGGGGVTTGDVVSNVTVSAPPGGFGSMTEAERRRFADDLARRVREGQAAALRQVIRDIGRER